MIKARGTLDFADFTELTQAAAAPHGAADIYRRVEDLAQRALGHRLFTIMRFHEASLEVERAYSSRPDVYPPGGRKQKRGSPWADIVLGRGEVYLGRNADDIRWAFDDHALILGLGLEAVLNVPVSYNGRRLGTMNILNGAGWYQDDDIPTARTIAGLLAPELLST